MLILTKAMVAVALMSKTVVVAMRACCRSEEDEYDVNVDDADAYVDDGADAVDDEDDDGLCGDDVGHDVDGDDDDDGDEIDDVAVSVVHGACE